VARSIAQMSSFETTFVKVAISHCLNSVRSIDLRRQRDQIKTIDSSSGHRSNNSASGSWCPAVAAAVSLLTFKIVPVQSRLITERDFWVWVYHFLVDNFSKLFKWVGTMPVVTVRGRLIVNCGSYSTTVACFGIYLTTTRPF